MHFLLNLSSFLGAVTVRASTDMTVRDKSQEFVGQREGGHKLWTCRSSVSKP
jgi:hypothetical protein